MKKGKKGYGPRVLIGLLLIAAIALGLGLKGLLVFGPPHLLRLALPFEAPEWREAFAKEAREFEGLNKKSAIELMEGDFAGVTAVIQGDPTTWDLALFPAGMATREGLFAEPARALTGSFWGIYYNKALLARAGLLPELGKPGLAGRLAEGSYSLADFSEACLELSRLHVTPIALGSQFGWPLAVWIQAIMATASPQEAETLVREDFDPSSPALAAALSYFRSLVEAGFVDPRHASRDWPESLKDVLSGRAAFCLVNEDYVAALPPSERAALAYLPLPASGSAERTNWAIGSLVYLGLNAKSKEVREGRRFLDYLTSQGVTARLAAHLARPFFSLGRGPDHLISSIATKPASPLIRAMQEAVSRR